MAKKKTAPLATPPANTITVNVESPLHRSFRVDQLSGMFDVPLEDRCGESFTVELPTLDEPWQIGLVVGPSGSGKSTIARHAWPSELIHGFDWHTDRAVIDDFGERSVKEITAMLTAVGFSSPPNWLRPFAVLSNGEKFRCELARALLGQPIAPGAETPRRLIVFDEFTSVVDRTVAKIGSAAVAKQIRRMPELRFVAVGCHYDIAEWLEPDWVLDMATRKLERRRLRRPRIELELFHAGKDAWELFKRAHYLSHSIPAGAKIWVATWHGRPVACVVTAVALRKVTRGYAGERRISRLVVLPDYQGVGIGRAVLNRVAAHMAADSYFVRIATAHPSMISLLKRDPQWKVFRVTTVGNKANNRPQNQDRWQSSFGRGMISAQYIGPKFTTEHTEGTE